MTHLRKRLASGFRLVKAQAGFVDDRRLLGTSKGVNNAYPLFIVIEVGHSHAMIGVFEDVADILDEEPRFSVLHDGANGAFIELEFSRQTGSLAVMRVGFR